MVLLSSQIFYKKHSLSKAMLHCGIFGYIFGYRQSHDVGKALQGDQVLESVLHFGDKQPIISRPR